MYSLIEKTKHRNNVMKLCMTRVSQQGGWQFSQPIGRHAWRHVIFIYVTQLYYTVTELLWPSRHRCSF